VVVKHSMNRHASRAWRDFTCPSPEVNERSMGSRSSDKNNQLIAQNKKARHDYAIEQTWEAGVVLFGSEVKSLREGRVTFTDGHVDVRDGELFLVNVHIHEYRFANRNNHEVRRPRKLLLHRNEMNRIASRVEEKGFTAVPLKLYFKDGRIKVEIGIGKGKQHHDKRQELKNRVAKREVARAVKDAGR
jgi:SsrA-binding protein